MTFISFDENATTTVHPQVIETITQALHEWRNPSQPHKAGRQARAQLMKARRFVCEKVGLPLYRCAFTASGTEANNLVLYGCKRPHIICSAIEHAAVHKPAALWADDSHLHSIPVNSQGLVCLNALETLLKNYGPKSIVSVMAANNETGVIQDIKAIVTLAHKYNALVHCDAIQVLGKADFPRVGADYYTLSGHKIGAGPGVGCVLLAPCAPWRSLIQGGGQEEGLRAGTENLPAILGFETALSLIDPNNLATIKDLRTYLEASLRQASGDKAIIFSDSVPRLAGTCCVAWPGVLGSVLLMGLDMQGFGVSQGAACSSGKMTHSPILTAMGVSKDLAACAIRISLGVHHTKGQIDGLVQTWQNIGQRALG
jgi:cysteine desulfurase